MNTMRNMSWGFAPGGVNDGNRIYWTKSGLLAGLQSGIVYNPFGLTYVVFFARNGITSPLPEHSWYPYWQALADALSASNLSARTDRFPTYGMLAL